MTATEEHEVQCPGCELRFPVKVVTPGEEQAEQCDAAFPDANDTRCDLDPHPDEYDPEHSGVNAMGRRVTWRASELKT